MSTAPQLHHLNAQDHRNRKRSVRTLSTGIAALDALLFYVFFEAMLIPMFLVIGVSRALQVAVGVIAITIGFVHLKDFFAPGRGVSLSIPASAKPGRGSVR